MDPHMIVEALIQIDRGEAGRRVRLPIEISEIPASSFSLAAHLRLEGRERHYMYGDNSFWKPVSIASRFRFDTIEAGTAIREVPGVSMAFYSMNAETAPEYDELSYSPDEIAAFQCVQDLLKKKFTIIGENVYVRTHEPKFYLSIYKGSFLDIFLTEDNLTRESPNQTIFSLRSLDRLQSLRLAIKPRGSLSRLPEMLVPASDVFMNETEEEEAFISGTRKWLATELQYQRTGMLPVDILRGLRAFLGGDTANPLALGLLLSAIKPNEVRARGNSQNSGWWNNTVTSLQDALALAGKRCEVLSPALLHDIVGDLDGFTL